MAALQQRALGVAAINRDNLTNAIPEARASLGATVPVQGRDGAEQPMTTTEIAERLVALCRQGNIEGAQRELYAADAINMEPYGTALFPKETRGLAAIMEKGRKFGALIEQVHAMSISDPLVAGASFACAMHLDLTIKGHGRMSVDELCIYEVKDGRIICEQFTSRFNV